MVNFQNQENLVEVVPRTEANLPRMLTGRAVVWLEVGDKEGSVYHLQNPQDKQLLLAIEYINDEWYYLHWDQGKYFASSQSQIVTPISLGLRIHATPSLNINQTTRGSANTSLSDQSNRLPL